MSQTPNQNIWAKLFQIQKAFKTFAVTEDSEKKSDGGKSTYKYTPGWKIVEMLREQMDALGLMLVPAFTVGKCDVIEYPVYKLIGGTPMSFPKKEVHVIVNATFTWVDTTTGETAGPYPFVGAGANGTDKSTAAALSNAERYFLLKFFHITTREKDEELDAHDSDTVPGIPANMQRYASDEQAVRAQPVPQNGGYPPYGGQQQPYRQPYGGPQAPAPAYPVPQPPAGGASQQVNVFTSPPAYQPAGNVRPVRPASFNEEEPLIKEMISRLMYYEKDTPTHQQVLNEAVGILCANGFPASDENFVAKLKEAAQARRENRAPHYV